jgi:hypothetical protein
VNRETDCVISNNQALTIPSSAAYMPDRAFGGFNVSNDHFDLRPIIRI